MGDFNFVEITHHSCVKNEGLVFHGTARAVQLINSLLDGKNESIPNIHRELADNFPKNKFSRN